MKIGAAEQEALDLDELLLNEAFRRFTRRIFDITGMFQTTHVASAPTQSAFAEGRRSMALTILDLLASRRPDALLIILQASQPQPQEQSNGRRRYHTDDRDDD